MFLYVALVPGQPFHALLDGGQRGIGLGVAAVKLEQLPDGGIEQFLQGLYVAGAGVASRWRGDHQGAGTGRKPAGDEVDAGDELVRRDGRGR